MSGFGRAEREPGVVLQFGLVDLVDIEGGVGHHVVEVADRVVEVLVVGVAFSDVAAEAVDGEVHLGEPDSVAGLLLAVDRQFLAGVLTVAFDEVGGLDEHPACATSGVVDFAVEGFEDLDDEPDDRGGCEELATLAAFGEGRTCRGSTRRSARTRHPRSRPIVPAGAVGALRGCHRGCGSSPSVGYL